MKDVIKVRKCELHKRIHIYWEGKNKECPFCQLYEANKRLAEKNEKLQKKLDKYGKKLGKKKKKKIDKDDIPF